jgi:hypothetical protein
MTSTPAVLNVHPHFNAEEAAQTATEFVACEWTFFVSLGLALLLPLISREMLMYPSQHLTICLEKCRSFSKKFVRRTLESTVGILLFMVLCTSVLSSC